MSIAIIDYEAGNTGSLKYALNESGFESYIAYEPKDLDKASHIIFPGVGSFNKAMHVLRERKLDYSIKKSVLKRKIPILGICLGMHVLATKGIEGGETQGLDLIPGVVCLLESTQSKIRLPHIGWNETWFENGASLFSSIPSGSDFYFLHSYHFATQDPATIIAKTNYGCAFASVVMKDNIYGVQFHPEKSGRLGRQLLKNFASL